MYIGCVNQPSRRPTLEELSAELVLYTGRLVRAITRQAVGLSTQVPTASLRLLSQVDELGPVTIGALAAADRCSQPTMSRRRRRRCATRGWATKQPNPADARSSLVTLTEAGRTVLTEARRRARRGRRRPAPRPTPTTTSRTSPRPSPCSAASSTSPTPHPTRTRRNRVSTRTAAHRRPPADAGGPAPSHPPAAPRRLGGRVRLRDRVHGHRPGGPDPQADRRPARRDAEPGLAAVHQLHGRDGRRDADHRRGLQPDRRQAHAARPAWS